MELSLDHVGVAVGDLDRGAEMFAKLGFTLTQRSLHVGSTPEDPQIRPWGSGNHCAMLHTGYLEILGITDPDLTPPVRSLLARYEGTHIIALRCVDAAKTYAALSDRLPQVRQPVVLERDAPYGPRGNETRRLSFRNIYFDAAWLPECRFILIEHRTPDVLWQEHLLTHLNTAVALTETVICVDDVAATSARFSRITGADPQYEDGAAFFHLATGRLIVATPGGAQKLGYGRPAAAKLPFVSGFAVAVADMSRAINWMESRGVEFERSGQGFVVGPAQACGATVRFVKAD